MDLYLLFGKPWYELEVDVRVEVIKRISSVTKTFPVLNVRAGSRDVALRFSGREFVALGENDLSKVNGTRITFPLETALDSFFFNVEDQLSDASHPMERFGIKEAVPSYNSRCYHCGAPSMLLHSSNECSKNCRG